MAVDELANAGDSKGDLWMQDGKVLIQSDPSGLQSRDDLLDRHSCLPYLQLGGVQKMFSSALDSFS